MQFTVARALEHRALARENQRLRRAVDKTKRLGDLIGESAAMRDLFSLVQKLSHNRSSVLITGESGTGKEVVARTIHFHGAQADSPFVPVNCTAIPEGLLESELFGHVRGAFTGAHASKTGLFEQADGGTLFLDEIGDMGLALQAKLLRVLQDQEIRPVGGTQTVKVDVRIIAATHQDLETAIAEGRFREDLFYRLNVIPIRIPPLRERPEDIPPLVEGFLQRHGDGSQRFTPEAIALLQTQSWRGNARELENVVERTLALSAGDTVDAGDLPIGGDLAAAAGNEHAFLDQAAKRGVSLRELSDQYVERVLEATGGNKVQAARILGIDRKTLYRRGERNQRESTEQLSKEA